MKAIVFAVLFLFSLESYAQTDPEQILIQRETEKKWKKEHPGKEYNEENLRPPVDSSLLPVISQKTIAQYKEKDTLSIEKYCMVLAYGKLLSNKVSIQIDYGEVKSFWSDNRLKDETGKVATFNNVIDALNYMALIGWKLHSSLLLGSGPYVYQYVFKKEFVKTAMIK